MKYLRFASLALGMLSFALMAPMALAQHAIATLNTYLPEGTTGFSFGQDGQEVVEFKDWTKSDKGAAVSYDQKTKGFAVTTSNRIAKSMDATKKVTDITAVSVRKPFGKAQNKHWNAHLENEKIISFTLCEGGAGSGEGCVTATTSACEELKTLVQAKDFEEMRQKLKSCGDVVKGGYLNEKAYTEEEHNRAMINKLGGTLSVKSYPNHLSNFANAGTGPVREQSDAIKIQVATNLQSIGEICATLPLIQPKDPDGTIKRSPNEH